MQNLLDVIVARCAVVHANRVRALVSKIVNVGIERGRCRAQTRVDGFAA
jgi:hypothetical protein